MKSKISKTLAGIALAGAIALSGCTVVDSPNQNEKEQFSYEESFGANYCGMDEFYDEENRICSEDRIYSKKRVEEKTLTLRDYDSEFLKVSSQKIIRYKDVVYLRDFLQEVNVKESKNYECLAKEIENKLIDSYNKKQEISLNDLTMYLIANRKMGSPLKEEEERRIRKSTSLELFNKYINFADEWRNKDYVTTNKYVRISTLSSWSEAEDERYNALQDFFNKYGTKLEDILTEFSVKEKYPKIPRWFWTTLGLIFPMVRNIGLTCWLTKNNPNDTRVVGSFLSGVLNGSFGTLFLDGLHPLVFPIRMLATPIIVQPFLKAIKFYDENDGDNPWF